MAFGSTASENMKSITRPKGSTVRFWSAEASAGAATSSFAIPLTARVETLTSATLSTPLACSEKVPWIVAKDPNVIVRRCNPVSKAKIESLRSWALPPVVSVQFWSSSAVACTRLAPAKSSTIVSPPTEAGSTTCVALLTAKVGAFESVVVTATAFAATPASPVACTVCSGVTRASQVTVTVAPAWLTVWAVWPPDALKLAVFTTPGSALKGDHDGQPRWDRT